VSELDPGLQALFLLLRSAGIAVGLEEVRRLATIFAMEPELDEHGLRRVVETILVKSQDERAVFDRVYRRWLEVVDQQIAAREAPLMKAKKLALEDIEAEADARPGRGAAGQVPGQPPGAPQASPVMKPAGSRTRRSGDAAAAPVSMKTRPASLPAPAAPGALHDFSAPLTAQEQAAALSALSALAARDKEAPGPAAAPHAAALSRSRWKWPAVIAALWLVGMGIWWFVPEKRSEPQKFSAAGDAGPGERAMMNSGMRPDSGQLVTHLPAFAVSEQEFSNHAAYGLIALFLLLGAGLWLTRGRGRRVPGPQSRRARSKLAPRAPHDAPRPGDSLILDERDEEDLVWGVGRFVSDEDGRDLDVDRTVDDTASAFGRPVLRYQAARYQREAWLWVDESLDTPVARHLASDLATMLERSGLPVVRASFWGIPENLHVDEGDEDITVDAFDARRDSAAVAILTDGRLLGAAHRARNRRDDVHRLLHNLSFWPRVTFIDFGRGDLRAIARPHGMRVILPQDAPAAISELAASAPWPEPGQLFGDARAWAAACVLTPLPVSCRTALSLRRTLGLKASPWALEVMRDCAERDAGGLTWPTAYRAELLSWLVRAQEISGDGALAQTGLLARVVDAWRKFLDERERAQRKLARERGAGWKGSAAAVEIQLERGLISLWTQPDQAAATLYELACAGHGERIRHYLGELAPRECEARPEEIIILPWRLRDLRRRTQVWLRQMGLAARFENWPGHHSMPRPARLWLALGLCVGLALGTGGALIEQGRAARQRPPMLIEGDRPDKGYAHMEPAADGQWSVQAGSLWSEPVRIDAIASQEVAATWHEITVRCSENLGGVEIHRCTSENVAPETSKERWSFAIISTQYEAQARGVARELLDSGSVDGVFLVNPSVDHDALDLATRSRPGDRGKQDQLLVIVPELLDLSAYTGRAVVLSYDDLGLLRGILDFERGREMSLAAALEAAGTLERLREASGDPNDFMVRGLGECGARGEPCCGLRDGAGTCDDDLDECDDGVCVAPPAMVCEPGARKCEGNTALICTDDGTAWDRSDCGADRVCDEGQCVAKTCSPGEVICSPEGRVQRVCNSRGTGYAKRPCPGGTLCATGTCQQIQGAIIEFAPVRAELPMQARQGQTYIECRADGSQPVRLRAAAPTAERVRIELDVPQARARSFTVACSLIRRIGNRHEVLESTEDRHLWDLSSERGTHRQTVHLGLDSGARAPGGDKRPATNDIRESIRIIVRYTIALKLAGSNAAQGSADGQ
jgi:hypothetical protein